MKCEECGKEFQTEHKWGQVPFDDVGLHPNSKYAHLEHREYNCALCGQQFVRHVLYSLDGKQIEMDEEEGIAILVHMQIAHPDAWAECGWA